MADGHLNVCIGTVTRNGNVLRLKCTMSTKMSYIINNNEAELSEVSFF